MIYSHTIVRNGEPFIEPVLRQVAPFMEKMIVTVSERSTDHTYEILKDLQKELREKLFIDTENVSEPYKLTMIRQKQLDMTPKGKWVLFLDDDDFWPKESLNRLPMFLGNDVDGFAFNPYQLVNKEQYDSSWWNKWFTKVFKNQNGVHYEHPWPRDLIYKGNKLLYWKKNPRVPRLPLRFFHLSYLKDHSFRSEAWAGEFKFTKGKLAYLPKELKSDIKEIFKWKN